MVPLELQRRVVNDAIGGGNVRLLVLLASIYLAVVLLQVGLKYLLRMYQNWVGESATRYTRMHLSRLNAARRSDGPGESGGRAAAIIGAEVEQLRSEEHTSELQSLMRISYAVFCLKKKKHTTPKL